jgi:phosphatidate phosphatase APP1
LGSSGTGSAVPDVTVILGSTGGSVGGANVYLDGSLAGKTDSKGNFTFKEAPASGNHTIMVSAKGIKNATVEANFAEKPVVVKADASKGYKTTVHVTDKASKQGIAGVSVINNKYVMGTTDVSGDLVINDYPMGIYLIKLEKEGYKTTTTVLIVYANKTQSFSLTPAA